MEGDPTTANQGDQSAAPVADQDAQPSAQQATGGSGDWLDREPSEETAAFRDFLRSDRESESLTSKPGADAGDGGSAPSGDVKPPPPERGADGKFVPRRAVSKVLAEAEAKVAAADPDAMREQIRAEILAEQQQSADNAKLDEMAKTRGNKVALYRRLADTPDDDPSLDEPGEPASDGTPRTLYQWREDFKKELRSLPEVEATHRELARQTIESERTAQSARETAFLNGQYEQMARLAARAGIEPERWKAKGTTFESMAEDYAGAREQRVRAELGEVIRELEDQVRQFGLSGPRGLAAARSGLNGGAPGGPILPTNENDVFRQWLRSERAE